MIQILISYYGSCPTAYSVCYYLLFTIVALLLNIAYSLLHFEIVRQEIETNFEYFM